MYGDVDKRRQTFNDIGQWYEQESYIRPRPEILHSVSDVRTSKVCGAKINRNVIQIRRDIISLRHRARDMDLVVVWLPGLSKGEPQLKKRKIEKIFLFLGHSVKTIQDITQHSTYHGVRLVRNVCHRYRLWSVRGHILRRDSGGAGQEAGTLQASAASRGSAGGGVWTRPSSAVAAPLPLRGHSVLRASPELRRLSLSLYYCLAHT